MTDYRLKNGIPRFTKAVVILYVYAILMKQKYFCYFRAMRNVQIDSPPVSFTENGIIEQVELNILNVRPYRYERRFRRVVNKWEEVTFYRHFY